MAESQTTEAPAQEPEQPAPTEPSPKQPDPIAEVDRLREELKKARKWEDRAKANSAAAKELDALKQQSMTDLEKAVEQARKEAASETTRAFGARLVDAEVKAAAAGSSIDVDALLDGLDRSRFLTDDGEPDTDAIGAWVERIAPKGTDGPQTVDLGQGQQGSTPALNSTQLERDLKSKLGI